MNVSYCGAGKLGLTCALAAESKGHDVRVYDIDPNVKKYLKERKIPYIEKGAPELLKKTKIEAVSLEEVVEFGEIIFVPIQTPHLPKYEGITRLPDERVDFDYTYLKAGVKDLANEIKKQGKEKIVAIISTVLPGTIEREIKPLLNDKVKLCYSPAFIAMGTTIDDYLNPEFVLFGVDDKEAATTAEEFYKTIHVKPFYKCTVEEAELIKVLYNTFISTKICLANTYMELCHKTPNTNVDKVVEALFLATDRIISTKYLRGGCGDGGGCHNRDNIALSWLSRKLDVSYDWFEHIIVCREKQTEFLADLIQQEMKPFEVAPVWILGKAFKKGTNLEVGSPAILLKNILNERGVSVYMYDPHIDEEVPEFKKAIYFIGTNHDEFKEFKFPKGSIVIDPWRMIKDQKGLKVIRIGE